VLCAAVTGVTAAFAAEPEDDQPASKSVLDPLGLFRSNKSDADKPAEPNKKIQTIAPNQTAEAAARHNREVANYIRRLAVCLELRDLAQKSGDVELERRVDQIEARVFEVYKQRIATGQPSAPLPQPVQKLTEKPPPPARERRSPAPWARNSRSA